MISYQSSTDSATGEGSLLYYGWAIVAATSLMIAVAYGVLYSYSVFLKPLGDHFIWTRGEVSLIYSLALLIRGGASIGAGWLADRVGPMKISAFCSIVAGIGLILCAYVENIVQFFFTYAVILAVGLSGVFGIGTAVVSRWFIRHRGLALGIAASGAGVGMLLIVPGTERIIHTFGWSKSFMICGVLVGVLLFFSSLVLRQNPPVKSMETAVSSGPVNTIKPQKEPGLAEAMKDSRMLLFAGSLFLFFFGIQMVIVHLVSYATDVGIRPLTAATFMSVIGAVSIAGRISTGFGADRIGVFNTLILTRLFLLIAFVWLLFSSSVESFYLFAVIFGVPYGGEVTQIPMFIIRFWGTRQLASLVGINVFIITIGGAMGSWAAGEIFDAAQSYRWAFVAGIIASAGSLLLSIILKRLSLDENPQKIF